MRRLFAALWSRCFGVKQEVNGTVDLYYPKQREIYHYFDGTKVRDVDPLPVYRRMKDVITDLEIEFKVAASEMKGSDEHYNSAVARIRKIFDLKEFSEGGLTEKECVDLFKHFFSYSGGVKKKRPQSTTPSPETSGGTPPNTAPAPEPTLHTTSSSDSGSIEGGQNTTPQAEFVSASVSPQE